MDFADPHGRVPLLSPDPPPPFPAARPLLGLQWQAVLAMVFVLGVAHLVIGLLNFGQLSNQHREQLRERMATHPHVFAALQRQAAESMGELALQLAAVFAMLMTEGRDGAFLKNQAFGGFVALEFFGDDGRSLGVWDAPGSKRPSDASEYADAVAAVLASKRPVSLVACLEECVLYAFVPSFDEAGGEMVVAIGQPLSETLLSFQRLSATDVALIRVPAKGSASLWERAPLAVTSAPQLKPLLQSLPSGVRPAPGAPVAVSVGGRQLRLSMAPLPQSADPQVQLLFIVDETASIADIREQLLRSLGLNAMTLVLSSGVAFLLLTPALRRLRGVTLALPLLAERQFAAARMQLQPRPRQRRKDEIDVLRDAALSLSHRLETLDKAEAANEEKSRFLATMSHEIRTPMNGILGLLELLEGGQLNADERDAVRIARDSGRTLLRVIDDILDFSRIEAAQIELEQIPFILREVTEDAVETLAPSARSKGLRLTVFIDPDLPVRLLGDPLRLRQVLFNLCSNAIKFTPSGRVRVRVEPGVEAGPAGTQRLRFRVVDTGIGLPPDARDRLFRPFTQADSTTTRRFGGTGLGLSIVHGLVTRMGGKVDFTSESGRGSEFWFEIDLPLPPVEPAQEVRRPRLAGLLVGLQLPDPQEAADIEAYLHAAGASVSGGGAGANLLLCEPAEPSLSHARLEIRSGDRVLDGISRPVRYLDLVRRLGVAAGLEQAVPAPLAIATESDHAADGPWVLVAEDHPVNQQVIMRQLNQLGYRAELASDGAAALARLDAHEFVVLLADLHMPNLDGIQLTRAVRAAERAGKRAGRLPIIALTAAALSGERDRCREAGMDSFLIKPAGLDQLREALERAMRTGPAAAKPPAQTAAKPVASEAAPIDLDSLLDLAGGDQDFTQHLMGEFLRVNEPVMTELERRLRAESEWNAAGVRALAHRLLGSARTVSAVELSAALSRLEGYAESDQAGPARDCWPGIAGAFAKVRSFIAGRSAQA